MQYVCSKCGEYFDKPQELKNMGGDIGESVFVCPFCGCDEYIEVVECAVCGDVVYESDTHECVCDKCLERYAGRKFAMMLGDKNYEYIKVNSFLYLFFDEEAVKKMLIEKLRSQYWDDEIEEKGRDYCLSDRWEFANYLKKEGVYL